MKKDVYLNAFSLKLGSVSRDILTSEAEGLLLHSAEKFREAGFFKHNICRNEENSYDLAKGAVEQLQNDLKGTNTIIYATCLTLNGNLGSFKEFTSSRDVKPLMDYPASHLQSDFHLDEAAVIGLNQQACTSTLGALRLAKALISSEEETKKVLCVSADRFPEGAHYEQAYNVISDGACACIVSTEQRGYKIIATHAITNGALAQASDDETVGSYFSYTHRTFTEVVEKAGLTLQDIDWVIPQNTNINAWTILSRLLGIEVEKVYFKTIRECGHIISSDNIANLLSLEAEGKVKSNDKLLLFMAGFGLNWQAVILEKV